MNNTLPQENTLAFHNNYPRSSVLALDFDGVICNSWEEFLMVVWHGYHGHPLGTIMHQRHYSVPEHFVTRFTHYRPFTRHLGHFILSVLPDYPEIHSFEEFEALYQTIKPEIVATFLERVTSYREQVRTHYKAHWHRLHQFYPGIIPFLAERVSGKTPLYIVTARDRVSTLDLLESQGIILSPDQVFGEQQNKLAALSTIATREQIERGALAFVDDHLLNVLSASADGYQAYWATWGLPEPRDQFKTEQRQMVHGLTLDQLPMTFPI